MIGVVVIGRNEGERLRDCLRSLQATHAPVVYVDSGSVDGSAEMAETLAHAVVRLDPAIPFSAARARNEGARHLAREWPGVQTLQFLDGDCLLAPGWLKAAQAALDAEPTTALVVGHLDERFPERSVYNRLCQLEWRAAPGLLDNPGAIGGLMAVRRPVFEALGGFNAQVVAGEDSEFGVRVAAAGHRLRRLDVPMATHDADILRFGQWWTRSVRAGHAIGQRVSLHGAGPSADCRKERRSTVAWGLLWPVACLLGLGLAGSPALLMLGAYPVLGLKIYRYRRSLGDSPADSQLYARFTVLAKFANAWGLLRHGVNRLRGRYRIIEYK